MKIDPAIVSEKNYTGSRLIQVNSMVISKLKKELNNLQKKASPTLKKMEDLSKVLDPYFTEIREHQMAIDKVKEAMKPTRDLYDIEMKKVELIDQKAQLIKNKIQPLVLKEITGKLGEFEKALHVNDKNGVLFVEVVDELEEKIKEIRASKAKK